jgi:GMP synthase PP-ATPase subunit
MQRCVVYMPPRGGSQSIPGRIVNEVKAVSSVVYDGSGKPPATSECE